MDIVKRVSFVYCFVTFVDTKIMAQSIARVSEGFMSDCPGSDLPVKIPESKLNELFFVVYKSQTGRTYRRDYAYSHAAYGIAKDPMIDWRRRTVIYVPGYMETIRLPFAGMMGAAYSELGYNVLLLDTTHFTIYPYPVAARIARAVGANAAKILANLVQHGLNPKSLEIVGVSLGSHIASFIGKQLRTLTATNISRITGLDPAGPCFRNLPPSSRLDSSDADFVDVIHTNINGFGGAKPWGHVDFYVNGGQYQVSYIPVVPCLTICSHIRALFLWREALRRPHAFKGIKCESEEQAEDLDCYIRSPMETNTMGLLTNKNLTGIFLLNTSNKPPYGLGKSGLGKQFEFTKTVLAKYNRSTVKW